MFNFFYIGNIPPFRLSPRHPVIESVSMVGPKWVFGKMKPEECASNEHIDVLQREETPETPETPETQNVQSSNRTLTIVK